MKKTTLLTVFKMVILTAAFLYMTYNSIGYAVDVSVNEKSYVVTEGTETYIVTEDVTEDGNPISNAVLVR